MTSIRAEDLLSVLYDHAADGAIVPNAVLVERTRVSPGAVSAVVKALTADGLVERVRYHGARLTTEGTAMVRRMLRRRRVLELFLTLQLGYDWDEVGAEASQLAHATSDGLIERLAAFLGDPMRDPHGAPIPDAVGTVSESDLPTLAELTPGDRAVVVEVRDERPDVLRYLGTLALRPGREVEVLEHLPFDGGLRASIGDREILIALQIAGVLRVERNAGRAISRQIEGHAFTGRAHAPVHDHAGGEGE